METKFAVVCRAGCRLSRLAIILGEGETSLLPLVPRESITEIAAHPGCAAQRAWESQLARWRREAEIRCEAQLHELEAMVISGAAFRSAVAGPSTDGQTSAIEPESVAPADPSTDGQMSALAVAQALGTLVHGFDVTWRSPGRSRHFGCVTLRLRVSETSYWQYRSRERLHRRFGPPGPFLRFLCLSLIGAWKHTLMTGVAYEHIYARDRFRCASPVCSRRDVTPHHLKFRSHGGGDQDENLLSACSWCHLEGIHVGRLTASPPASDVRWEIGRMGHTVIEGRRKAPAAARA